MNNNLSILPVSNDVVMVAYDSNNFYWKSVNYDESACNSYTRCYNDNITNGNNILCYQNEVCENKKKSNHLLEIQKSHSGSDVRYTDIRDKFHYSLLTTVNLGMGIIAILSMIHGNLKK